MDLSIKQLLKKHSIRPSKKLGQIFLIDAGVLKKIVEVANLSNDDTVLEIGPGLGILTIELAKRVKQVIAIEKDKKMCEILSEVLDVGNVRNVEIINKDILKISNDKIQMPNEIQSSNYKLVANLPYYITSPVIRKFLETDPPGGGNPELMILMVQKEVAQRITAKPPKMSLLSVAVQFYADAEIVDYVSKKSFYPQPKVDSAIIKIVPKVFGYHLRAGYEPERARSPQLRGSEGESPSSARWAGRGKREDGYPKTETEQFFQLVKAGFSSKRKMLKNNLSRKLKIKSQKLKIVFEKIGIDLKIRAQDLSVEDWLKLYEKLKTYV